MLFLLFLVFGFSLGTIAQIYSESGQGKLSDSVQINENSDNARQAHLWHVCPNPFQEKLMISLSKESCNETEASVKIYDLFSGKCIFESKFQNRLEIQTPDWRKGLFAIYISHDRDIKVIKAFKDK